MAAKPINLVPIFIVIGVLLIIDLYVFKGLKTYSSQWQSEVLRRSILTLHWVIFTFMTGWILWSTFNVPWNSSQNDYKNWYFIFGFSLMFYIPKLIFATFILADDIIFGVRWAISLVTPQIDTKAGETISRMQFIYQTGAVVAAVPFVGVAYGMLKGRFDWGVKNIQLPIANLPKEFEGLTMVQLSDLHLGSFFKDKASVQKAFDLIKEADPDILVVTGDWVNNYASEAEDWIEEFKALPAKIAKLGIVGNHDYGDYVQWEGAQDKAKNFNRLLTIHKEMGFTTLMNQNHIIKRNGQEFAILGVENWGVKPFPQYGDLDTAKKGTENAAVKVLLSHDPTHFEKVVLNGHNDIDLTLSGHTHGAQFGVELGNVKWSPVKYKYPRWAGMYEENGQKLYVNRGFGYLAFPGRVGISPEITKFTFTKA